MDVIYGNEHTTNPPVIIAPISTTPIIVSPTTGSPQSTGTPEPSTRTPSPSPLPDSDADSSSRFNTGKKVKRKPNKMDDLLNLLNDNLAIKQEDLDEKKREREERRRDRERVEAVLAESQADSKRLTDAMTLILETLAQKL
jgi:hypothetical protein